MKTKILAAAVVLGALAIPAFAGQGYGNGPRQVTSYSAPVASSHDAAAPQGKTRDQVKAELKAYRDAGQPNKDVYFGN